MEVVLLGPSFGAPVLVNRDLIVGLLSFTFANAGRYESYP